MKNSIHPEGPEDLFQIDAFNITSLDDEIRADQLIGKLLRLFFRDQTERLGQEQEVAGRLARGADYFLREFVIADRRDNVFLIQPERVRQFAGNWYIVRNLEPNMAELGDVLEGVAAFYAWLSETKRIASESAKEIEQHCQDLNYYQHRIESFWAIEDNGFIAWNQACPFNQGHA